MTDPELLYLTASEPLSLEEELLNQESWLMDPTKYTFLIFYQHAEQTYKDPQIFSNKDQIPQNITDLIQGYEMVGDINLFFHEYMEKNECEIDVMIAEKQFRGKGIAKQVVQIMMQFANCFYQRNRIIAKIKQDNTPSINLFEKLSFTKFADMKQFEEVHYDYQYTNSILLQEFQSNYNLQQINLDDYITKK